MIDIPAPVVLASGSPTRRVLLGRLLREFEVVSPAVCEEDIRPARPEQAATARAVAKAHAVAPMHPAAVVIAADTVVGCRGELIGKPACRDEALEMLRQLTRSPHRVFTGLCVVSPDGRERVVCDSAEVRMRALPLEKLKELARRPDALDRAGAYALEPDDPNVLSIEGSETTVMGLPLETLERILLELCSRGQTTDEPA